MGKKQSVSNVDAMETQQRRDTIMGTGKQLRLRKHFKRTPWYFVPKHFVKLPPTILRQVSIIDATGTQQKRDAIGGTAKLFRPRMHLKSMPWYYFPKHLAKLLPLIPKQAGRIMEAEPLQEQGEFELELRFPDMDEPHRHDSWTGLHGSLTTGNAERSPDSAMLPTTWSCYICKGMPSWKNTYCNSCVSTCERCFVGRGERDGFTKCCLVPMHHRCLQIWMGQATREKNRYLPKYEGACGRMCYEDMGSAYEKCPVEWCRKTHGSARGVITVCEVCD